MCKTGEELRDKWYLTATIVDTNMDTKNMCKMIKDNRASPEYMLAKEAYVKHIMECDECKMKK